jgi:hypothetical protein
MWDCTMNLKTAEIAHRDDLSGLEREWLLNQLLLKWGVRYALYHPADSHRLIVEYDADELTALDLWDFLNLCGVTPRSTVPVTAPESIARYAAVDSVPAAAAS